MKNCSTLAVQSLNGPFVARLQSYGMTYEASSEWMRQLVRKTHTSNTELISTGEILKRPSFLLSGWVCLATLLPDGSRQILDLYVPGDVFAYSSRPRARAKANYISLTPVHVAFVDRREGVPTIAQQNILHMYEEAFESRILCRLLGMRLTAPENMMALLHDLHDRLRAAHLTSYGTFQMPLSQEVLGENLGISVVHVNRVLQYLKRKRSIAMSGKDIELLDAALEATLNLPGPAAEAFERREG